MADPAPSTPPAIKDKLAHCWKNGNGIGETIVIVRRAHGQTLTFEQVRSQFAALAAAHG